MMDIDHFKNFNDTYGHQIGDDVLKVTSKIVTQSLRDVDLAARYGGEEICVILPETGRDGAWIVGERIRTDIENNRVPGPNEEQLQVKMSLGIAIYSQDIKSPEELLKRADTALYQSKDNGRNKCTIWEETMPENVEF
jgi:diguanylate cyclase (GGDEF)-like protein